VFWGGSGNGGNLIKGPSTGLTKPPVSAGFGGFASTAAMSDGGAWWWLSYGGNRRGNSWLPICKCLSVIVGAYQHLDQYSLEASTISHTDLNALQTSFADASNVFVGHIECFVRVERDCIASWFVKEKNCGGDEFDLAESSKRKIDSSEFLLPFLSEKTGNNQETSLLSLHFFVFSLTVCCTGQNIHAASGKGSSR
jgi:hypothetical protein